MYSINLIHEKIVPLSKQRTRMSLASLYVLLWLISGVVIGYYIMTMRAEINSYTLAARRLETRNSLPAGLTQEDVSALGKQLQASKDVLASIQAQSFIWASKLFVVRSVLPSDAWLNRLYCRPSTTHFAKAPDGGRQLPQPLGEFVIEGMVLIPEGAAGAEALEQFVTKLRENKIFMEKIASLNHLVVGRERFGNREVATFVIVCVLEEGVRFDA